MNENEKYIINEDYHGDVKVIKVDKPKKIDLSKPTDTLECKSKQIQPLKVTSSNEKICLTKPQDTYNTIEKTSSDVYFKYLDKKYHNETIFSIFGFKFDYAIYQLMYENMLTLIAIMIFLIVIGLYIFNSYISLTKIIIEIVAILILIFSIKVSDIVAEKFETPDGMAKGIYYLSKVNLVGTIIMEVISLCKDIFL